ncbi:DNA-directed RNA polymerase I subunit RPA2 [Lamellibrachia satsuma]|nr:DNA-directed RNA polymerase I subunit RPA2 [Lamellibrachia satsuma]
MNAKKPTFRHLTCRNYGKPKNTQHMPLQEITRPHIDSFNHLLREGLTKAVQEIIPVEFGLENGQRVALSIKDAMIYTPLVPPNSNCTSMKVYPAECRERGCTYRGKLNVQLVWTVDGIKFGPEERAIGIVPIMVKSAACNLAGLTPSELIKHGEEAEEMGGYFIINGIERIIRMLVMPRRNYPLALMRPSWKSRGVFYTEFGVSLRSVKHDQTSSVCITEMIDFNS